MDDNSRISPHGDHRPDAESPDSRLGLGTAQFGLNYGIANRAGKCDRDEIGTILSAAVAHGLRFLDTAPAYGDSETVLGEVLPFAHPFRIVAKTPVFSKGASAAKNVRSLTETFTQSLHRLRLDSVYGLLVHHAEDLLADREGCLWDAMEELKAKELVSRIGVSVYSAPEIDAILDRFPIDIIQLPLNLFDQRLLQSGHLQELKSHGVEIHARSIFLQGLLLLPPEDIPPELDEARPHIIRLRAELTRRGISPRQAALGFVKSISQVDAILVGVDSHRQLIENIAAFDAETSMKFEDFALFDETILNPSLWHLIPA